MKRSTLNFLIDVVMLLAMAALAGLGILMEFVLVPGRDRAAIYGRQVDLYFLGLDRHAWGDVHLGIGLALLALLGLHIVLHWGQVARIYRGLVTGRPMRWALGLLLVVLCAALLAGPSLVTPEVRDDHGPTLHSAPRRSDPAGPGRRHAGHGRGSRQHRGRW